MVFMKTRGRPKVSKLSRAEQLLRAKRRQRTRQQRAGLVHVQLTLPKEVAVKLGAARKSEEFLDFLSAALDRVVLSIEDYPMLKDLAWNRTDDLMPAREAFNLYERNWRFVDTARLTERERALIERLAHEYGGGIVHA